MGEFPSVSPAASATGRSSFHRRYPIFTVIAAAVYRVCRLEPSLEIAYGEDKEVAYGLYVIAEPCIGVKDTGCVDACPVDCIHPKKNTRYDDGRPVFDDVSQLYIDPVECIDCGACVPVCPVSAIFALDDLPEKWKQFTELNASYVQGGKFTPEEFAKHQIAK